MSTSEPFRFQQSVDQVDEQECRRDGGNDVIHKRLPSLPDAQRNQGEGADDDAQGSQTAAVGPVRPARRQERTCEKQPQQAQGHHPRRIVGHHNFSHAFVTNQHATKNTIVTAR